VTQQLTVDIARDRTAPAAARRAVETFDAIAPDVVPDVKLLVSELITNSVKYGSDGEVTLILRSDAPEHVHVEVVDQGSGFVPVARARRPSPAAGACTWSRR
jgi:anti-sigma regulatory factor (Ser/Thr protein kinase)